MLFVIQPVKRSARAIGARTRDARRMLSPGPFCGLESFDAAVLWRTERGHGKHAYPIDPATPFHNSPRINDSSKLRDIIAGSEPGFARGFAKRLIGTGLGGSFGFASGDLELEMAGRRKRGEYTVSAFVLALMASKAFGRK